MLLTCGWNLYGHGRTSDTGMHKKAARSRAISCAFQCCITHFAFRIGTFSARHAVNYMLPKSAALPACQATCDAHAELPCQADTRPHLPKKVMLLLRRLRMEQVAAGHPGNPMVAYVAFPTSLFLLRVVHHWKPCIKHLILQMLRGLHRSHSANKCQRSSDALTMMRTLYSNIICGSLFPLLRYT